MRHASQSEASCRCLDSNRKIDLPAVAATMKGSIPVSAETVRPRLQKGVRVALQPRIAVNSWQDDAPRSYTSHSLHSA